MLQIMTLRNINNIVSVLSRIIYNRNTRVCLQFHLCDFDTKLCTLSLLLQILGQLSARPL